MMGCWDVIKLFSHAILSVLVPDQDQDFHRHISLSVSVQ